MSEVIEHIGIVVGKSSEGVSVDIKRTEACAACAVRRSCTVNRSNEPIFIPITEASTLSKLQEGQKVRVQLSTRAGWKAVGIAYLIPLVILMAVILIASYMGADEGIAAVIGLGMMGIYYLLLWVIRNRIDRGFVLHIDETDKE